MLTQYKWTLIIHQDFVSKILYKHKKEESESSYTKDSCLVKQFRRINMEGLTQRSEKKLSVWFVVCLCLYSVPFLMTVYHGFWKIQKLPCLWCSVSVTDYNADNSRRSKWLSFRQAQRHKVLPPGFFNEFIVFTTTKTTESVVLKCLFLTSDVCMMLVISAVKGGQWMTMSKTSHEEHGLSLTEIKTKVRKVNSNNKTEHKKMSQLKPKLQMQLLENTNQETRIIFKETTEHEVISQPLLYICQEKCSVCIWTDSTEPSFAQSNLRL